MTPLSNIDRALEEVEAGALFVLNHSGGKDSQAMMIRVLEVVPRTQLVVVHATLGEVEWEGALDLAKKQAFDAGVTFLVAKAPKTFIELVQHRARTRPDAPAFPQSSNRQCTSDLKRDPIMTTVRRLTKHLGLKRVVTCMGLRAAESSKRAQMKTWSRSTRGSKAGREWFEWLPVHALPTSEVFETIRAAGQQPHWAYGAGNERLSCVFCIMGSPNDARVGAIHRPDLFRQYVELEKATGYTCHQSRKTLEEVAGLTVEQAFAEHKRRLPVIGGAS